MADSLTHPRRCSRLASLLMTGTAALCLVGCGASEKERLQQKVLALEGDVERSLVVTHAWRAQVPVDALVEAERSRHPHPGGRHDAPRPGDHDLDRTLMCVGPARAVRSAHRGAAAERGAEVRPGEGSRAGAGKDGTPGTLHPGGVAGVREVDTGQERGELASTDQSTYVMGQQPEGQRLRSRDHTVLRCQDRVEVRHPSTLLAVLDGHEGRTAICGRRDRGGSGSPGGSDLPRWWMSHRISGSPD